MKNPQKNNNEAIAKRKHDKKLAKNFKEILKAPEAFLSAQPEKFKDLSELLHKVYELAIKTDDGNSATTEILPELVLEEMHEEQIWQQLELRNNVLMPQLIEKAAKMIATREEKLEIRLKEDEDDMVEDGNEDETDPDEEDKSINEEEKYDDDDSDENEGYADKNGKKLKKKEVKPSIVDDKFFKLDEMEAFLEAEEAKEMRKSKGKSATGDDDGINYFDGNWGDESGVEDEENENPEYKDFFETDDELSEEGQEKLKENKIKQKDHFAEKDDKEDNIEEGQENDKDINNDDALVESDDENEEEEKLGKNKLSSETIQKSKAKIEPASDSDTDSNPDKDDQPKSSFELRQERFQQRIRDYEDEVLGEKPWQLKGEIQATSRPQNSLLEEVLEFESNTRPAPIITQETTRRLEDIIRQRIKDQAWDDVVLKVKPLQTPHEYRKQLVLDQEKSKISLAQVYEKEYQNEVKKLQPNYEETEKEEPKEHTEIRKLMNALFIKLDALSNFHFTPKPVAPEAKIITNTPAISMEEVAPVAVSDANLLAPEEILKGSKHAPIGESERTKTDKKRDRRKKKNKQRAIYKAQEANDIQKKKMGIALSKKEENAKLLKTITKQRNVEKITVSNDKGSLKSSKAFFSKLQDTTSSAAVKATKKKLNMPAKSAKKLKL